MSEADQPDDSGVSLSKLDQSALSETTPLVFQCSQCNTIVGDSLSWVSADKVMRTIALAYVSSKVGVKTEICMASSGRDQGSTYHILYCLQCNETLGKKYVASSPVIDSLRGHFNLDAEKLNSYKLGSSEQCCSDELANMFSVPNPKAMWGQISKIKYLLISMNERITALEGHHSFTVEERLETGGRNKVKESEERESDNKDTESVSSTENISSRFSYCSETPAEIEMSNHGRTDSDKKHLNGFEQLSSSESQVDTTAQHFRKGGDGMKKLTRLDKLSAPGNTVRSESEKGGPRKRITMPANGSSHIARNKDSHADTEFNEHSTDMSRGNKFRDSRFICRPSKSGQNFLENQTVDVSSNIAGSRIHGQRLISQQNRQHFSTDSLTDVTEFDGELESKTIRMETWPHTQRSSVKKRRRISSPQGD